MNTKSTKKVLYLFHDKMNSLIKSFAFCLFCCALFFFFFFFLSMENKKNQ